eukprot:TRINITY_DN31569_c1_g1_i1.p2 TRINITY_DN31569_c1_g1~~TRINITY_DN31569_c1_g1_i1.p2  ORF type:complete len:114 (+),score=4.91 TRINITY_DN31569_c1_g1_i1:174-515(+)
MTQVLVVLTLFLLSYLSCGTKSRQPRVFETKTRQQSILRLCSTLTEEPCCREFAKNPHQDYCISRGIFKFKRGEAVRQNMLGVIGQINTLIPQFYKGVEGTRCACRRTVQAYR